MPRSPFIGASLRVSCADRLSACSLAPPPFQAFVHHNVIAVYDRFPAFPQKKKAGFFSDLLFCFMLCCCTLLCGLNFVPIAVFNNGISFGNDYLALAYLGVGRIELIESSALNGNLGV